MSELTADLAEEHSTSTLATERLEAETAQRMKLGKEIQDLQAKFRQMSAEHEKLEMEVLVARSAGLNGDGGMTSGSNFGDADEEEEDDGTPHVFRQKCERLSRELQMAKQHLTQQHEDDLEQMVALKKQLEKAQRRLRRGRRAASGRCPVEAQVSTTCRRAQRQPPFERRSDQP